MEQGTMKRISIGDAVSFTTNSGRPAQGFVVDLITERRQPTMVLIERHDGGRAIRLENEVEPLDAPALTLARAAG
jgi:hypothetical protein